MTVVPGIIGCFACSGTDHWETACPERIPPKNKAEYEERIAKYVQWFRDDDPPRITPHQKQKLIETLNKMWRGDAPKGAK